MSILNTLAAFLREFSGQNDFVEFDASEFSEYDKYDKENPNRFIVEYDENLNRIWKD